MLGLTPHTTPCYPESYLPHALHCQVYQANIYVDDKEFFAFKKVACDMGLLQEVPLVSLHSISKGALQCQGRGGGRSGGERGAGCGVEGGRKGGGMGGEGDLGVETGDEAGAGGESGQGRSEQRALWAG